MGNGAKAATKRARNQPDQKKAPKSQLNSNVKAMNIICKTCRQTFLQTNQRKDLELHATKHNKTYDECF